MIRRFRGAPYRGDGEGRDCLVHAAWNIMFLLFDEHSAAYEFSRLYRIITLAYVRCGPHSEGRREVREILKIGRLVPVFQNTRGQTSWYQKTNHSSSCKAAVVCLSLQLGIQKGML